MRKIVGKLSYLNSEVPEFPVEKGRLIAKYGQIKNNRNKLFHGTYKKPIPYEEVEKALTKYDWIISNYIFEE